MRDHANGRSFASSGVIYGLQTSVCASAHWPPSSGVVADRSPVASTCASDASPFVSVATSSPASLASSSTIGAPAPPPHPAIGPADAVVLDAQPPLWHPPIQP